ncbi:MAG: Cell division and transport-associated protein TolR [candidate division TM6 bacterium GW2011_GWF2_32_72]|nr:MAG: Cell division and transport-associated protein TolR [candidate division TM6 bacterium GW2011_GWF2_32_72]
MNRFQKKRLKKQRIMPELSMTSMIDTAFTLLIIFMVATPMIQNSIKVELPQGQTKEHSELEKELVLFMDKKGKIFLEKDEVKFKDVVAKVKDRLGKRQDQTVFVNADQAVNYGEVIKLVDEIKFVGGVKYVALATRSSAKAA